MRIPLLILVAIILAMAAAIAPNAAKADVWLYGKRYDSYADYHGSPEWEERITNAFQRRWHRAMERHAAKQRRQRAVEFERRRRRYSASSNYLMDLRRQERSWAQKLIKEYRKPR